MHKYNKIDDSGLTTTLKQSDNLERMKELYDAYNKYQMDVLRSMIMSGKDLGFYFPMDQRNTRWKRFKLWIKGKYESLRR